MTGLEDSLAAPTLKKKEVKGRRRQTILEAIFDWSGQVIYDNILCVQSASSRGVWENFDLVYVENQECLVEYTAGSGDHCRCLWVTVDCRLLDTVLQSARSHGPIRFMLTSLPASLIGPCDLGG